MNHSLPIEPDWRWGTSEGSREFDRLTDRMLTFHEKLEWLEETETLSLRMQESRQKAKQKKRTTDYGPRE